MTDLAFDIEVDTAYMGGALAVYVRMQIDGRSPNRDTTLDPDALFESLRVPGRYPLLSCSCGVFDCGGAWADVEHSAEAWCMSYPNARNSSVTQHSFEWQAVLDAAATLVQELRVIEEQQREPVWIVGGRHEVAPIAEYQATVDTLRAAHGI